MMNVINNAVMFLCSLQTVLLMLASIFHSNAKNKLPIILSKGNRTYLFAHIVVTPFFTQMQNLIKKIALFNSSTSFALGNISITAMSTRKYSFCEN